MGKTIVALFVLIGVLVALSVWLHQKEAKEWAEFSAAHNCKVVGKQKGEVNVGYGFGVTASGNFGQGVVVTSTDDKTGYLCDDGVTYWR